MAKLFMVVLGATPPGRHTEQHDVFFGIADTMQQLLPQLKAFWPEAGKSLHIDCWREVNLVDGWRVRVVDGPGIKSSCQLFFINLGGYKPGLFEECHYQMLLAADSQAEAIRQARKTAFYRHTGFSGAASHIDDRYGIDVDETFAIADILHPELKLRYSISLEPADSALPEDRLHIGYFKLSSAALRAPEQPDL